MNALIILYYEGYKSDYAYIPWNFFFVFMTLFVEGATLSPASSLLKTKIKNEKGENMGKKKVKEDGVYLYANNAADVTGSSIFIRCNCKQI